MIDVNSHAQQEPLWANLKLGNTDLTMGRYGCYTTAIANKLKVSPKEMVERLNATGIGYTDFGLIRYDGIEHAFPGTYFVERVYTENDPSRNIGKMDIESAIRKIRKYLDLGQATVLCVDNVGNDGIPDHAVLAYDYVLDGDEIVDFRIMDPDKGRDILFSEKYGAIRDGVYGYVGIVSPTATFPDQSKTYRISPAFYKALAISRGQHISVYSREIFLSFLSG